jgi:alkylated DNA repair protein (DNA oxidative demethylase)
VRADELFTTGSVVEQIWEQIEKAKLLLADLGLRNLTSFMPARTSSDPLPDGFSYTPDFLSAHEESDLLAHITTLAFHAFQYRGYTGKRLIVEYGWHYDYSSNTASTTSALPDFLLPLRARAAEAAQLQPEQIVEAVVAQYPEGAPIGWHRDVPQFDVVIGMSLAGACRMRFRPYRAEGKPVSVTLEPRSLYVLRGAARWRFQHSIPAVQQLRYSITFRTLRAK